MFNEDTFQDVLKRSLIKHTCSWRDELITSSFCDYIDPYILIKGSITDVGTEDTAAAGQREKW